MKRLLSVVFICLVAIVGSAQWMQPQGVPAFNSQPPKHKLPAILAGAQLENFQNPVIVKAYKEAAKYSSVLHQLPCYCYCDRTQGHNSLHSCFETEHGANCSTCLKEALFAGQQTRKGKTPKQIREAIIKGEFEKIDLVKMNTALSGS